MISDREYRKGIPIAEAMRQIAAEAGKSFDPRVVEILEQHYVSLEERAMVQAAQGPVLSTEVLVERGAAPDAGLDLCGLPERAKGTDFLTTINAAAREEQLMRETAGAGMSLDPEEAMRRISVALLGKIPYDALVFFVRHANSLNAEFATGRNSECLGRLQVPLGDGLTGWVGQNLQAVVNGNPAVDPGFTCDPAQSLQSVLSLPLTGSQGLVAVLTLYRDKKDAFTRTELQLASAVAPNIASALQNALAHREVESRANLDALTGLHSRSQLLRFLDEELARARRNEQPVALLVAELHGYWEIAESLGYPKADELLVAISRGLQKASREYDRVGRIAENRFALVLPGMKPAYTLAILDRLHQLAAKSGVTVCGCQVDLKLGGAFYPDDADGARNLLSVAERKVDGLNERWEESLRALLRAGKPAPEAAYEEEPERSSNLVRMRPGERRTAR